MNNEEFKVFYETYHKFSASIIYEIVKDRSTTDEICNDVFYRFYKLGDKLNTDNEKKLRALIAISSRNCALDHLKKSYVRHEQCTMDDETWKEIEDERRNPERQILHVEETAYQKMILARLREEQPENHDILMKIKYLGKSPDEVAEEYGITRNNVNNRILRTKNWLQKELRKLYDD